jgi:hypothetical protein
MNSDAFSQWLRQEAENLYRQGSTPEIFMKRAKPLIDALANVNKAERFSEKDLHGILTTTPSQNKSNSTSENSFFDIVDLCLYRAN